METRDKDKFACVHHKHGLMESSRPELYRYSNIQPVFCLKLAMDIFKRKQKAFNT